MFYRKKLVLCLICSFVILGGCSNAAVDNTTESQQTDDKVTEEPDGNKIKEEVVSLIEKREYPQAIFILSKIKGDEWADDLLQQLRYLISGAYIANLNEGVAAIDQEGKVIIRMNDEEANGYAGTQNWMDIERLIPVFSGLDALNAQGGVLTTLNGEEFDERNEQLGRISGICLFETSESTYAVTEQSGRLFLYNKYNGYLENEAVQKEVESWTDIVDIVTGRSRVAVLHGDGTVSFVYSNKLPGQTDSANKYSGDYDDMHEWTDIVDISGGEIGNIAGLRADGTVLISNRMFGHAVGESYSQVSRWTDIVAISKSSFNILALRSDGTVLTAGLLNEGQKEVSAWTDIVAISAGQDFHLGLKSDGTLVVAGEKLMPDVSDVKGVYVPKIKTGKD